MAVTKLDDISEAIGSMRAEIRHLAHAQAENARKADEHRAIVHRRVDEVSGNLGEVREVISALRVEMTSMNTTVIDSKTITDEVKQWKQRGIGALFVTGIASASVSGIVVGFVVWWWEALMRLLRSA